MPNGKTHTLATAVVSGAVAGSVWWYVGTEESVFVIIGGVASMLISPDLDVDGGNISLYLLRGVNPVLSGLWRLIWFPYAKLASHRGFVSHFPFISTILRVIYLFLPLELLYYYITRSFFTVNEWFLVVLLLSDLTHITMDAVL